jgi:hypothetical protein
MIDSRTADEWQQIKIANLKKKNSFNYLSKSVHHLEGEHF